MLPNQVLNAIPERDEELEKFIQKKFDDESSIIADGEDEGHAVIYHVIFQECMRECSAFSDRRAREKAIEQLSDYWCEVANLKKGTTPFNFGLSREECMDGRSITRMSACNPILLCINLLKQLS
jgi:hypothetical protein